MSFCETHIYVAVLQFYAIKILSVIMLIKLPPHQKARCSSMNTNTTAVSLLILIYRYDSTVPTFLSQFRVPRRSLPARRMALVAALLTTSSVTTGTTAVTGWTRNITAMPSPAAPLLPSS